MPLSTKPHSQSTTKTQQLCDLQLIRHLILTALDWPLHNRPFVLAVAAFSAGRKGLFRFGHEFVAHVLGYTGKEATVRQRVRRDLNAYELISVRRGVRLFEFERGGGKTQSVTHYGRNLLNEAALQIQKLVADDYEQTPVVAKIDKYMPTALRILKPLSIVRKTKRTKQPTAGGNIHYSSYNCVALSERGKVALEHAKRGLRVFPLHSVVDNVCSCKSGAACATPGKHPRVSRWIQAATTSERVIAKWWTKWPEANIAIQTGVPLANGEMLIVIDCDKRKFGHGILGMIEDEIGALPETFTVTTGNGRHLYFTVSQKVTSRNDALGQGLDVKCSGGYVVAPGSIHHSGKLYEIEADSPIAALPEELVEFLAAKTRKRIVPAGERWYFLRRCARRVAADGFQLEEIVALLKDRRDLRCETGEGLREITNKHLESLAAWAIKTEREQRKKTLAVA